MTSEAKTIVVVGATGNQGSSVVRTFANLPGWHVRCVTRNVSSPASQELGGLGASLIQADLSDLDSLSAAFAGAHTIFVNTDFWWAYRKCSEDDETKSKESYDREVLHGKNAAIAAAAVPTLERFVYSALGPMRKASKGKYTQSFHWESKATIVKYIENEQPELWKKTSLIYLGAYATNALLMPRPDPTTGAYKLVSPIKADIKMPIIDTRGSTGLFVQALVEQENAGTKLLAYNSYPTMEEVARIWSRVIGQPVELVEVTTEFIHTQFGVPLEVLEAPNFLNEFSYMAGVDGFIEPAQLKVKVPTQSFEEWLKARGWEQVLGDGKAMLASVQK
ncbi:hypothetical protein ASPZODRAFT_86307 [Penicilliopsis zonata CBS 506.65]|uniref:NmrA-like domain-containing protein n=1 Tax=Penicilliopsis zonata CBS 506.65 TaxID=1073090 RepID=A0A1L9SU53_9EURO|nr:hypothetical protein ASPZODRAFT_86307 [Penicilliopsis zonata CBS 506.65]OJJ50732.1 hypothetical protein ASPZODRAFT_86307 [Penicilliopsis zonata CBS 506.65]